MRRGKEREAFFMVPLRYHFYENRKLLGGTCKLKLEGEWGKVSQLHHLKSYTKGFFVHLEGDFVSPLISWRPL